LTNYNTCCIVSREMKKILLVAWLMAGCASVSSERTGSVEHVGVGDAGSTDACEARELVLTAPDAPADAWTVRPERAITGVPWADLYWTLDIGGTVTSVELDIETEHCPDMAGTPAHMPRLVVMSDRGYQATLYDDSPTLEAYEALHALRVAWPMPADRLELIFTAEGKTENCAGATLVYRPMVRYDACKGGG
jgi:hypothetical protein